MHAPPLDDAARRRRREAARSAAVRRRRRAFAAATAGLATAALLVGVIAGAGGDRARSEASAADAPPELPTGGRRIFPRHRVVAYYGAPQDTQLGALGVGTPAQAVSRLRRQARAYERPRRPLLLGLELIATVAAASPGDDGLYRTHQPEAVIDRYLRAARRARALLILDIQPGRADFLSEARRLRRWLGQPDVGIALDPEWHVPEGVPGQVIGSVSADEVNQVADYLAGIVRRRRLPQKLFVIHRFTEDMVMEPERIRRHPQLAITLNVDGFGDRANKVSKYRAFASTSPRFRQGFKLFYEEDSDLMSPRQVLRLRPPPDLIVYE